MIDIHSHILPGIDDGAKDWSESIKMAENATLNGIRKLIATPHHQNGVYLNNKIKVGKLIDEFNSILQSRKIPIKVFPGNETQIYGDFVNDLINGQFFTLNDNKRYVFVELPSNEVPRSAEQVIFEIQLAGYIPIIPHPEKNEDIRNNPLKLYQLVKKGALTQITSSSLLGIFNKEVQKFTFQLIDNNLTHLIATDTHKADGDRGFNLKEAYDMLETYVGEDIVNQFKRNAEGIFLGKDIYVDLPIKIIKKKKFFGII
ncbi:MAG: tyrosine-protein phosphatase [Vulcanibacillus sp.]